MNRINPVFLLLLVLACQQPKSSQEKETEEEILEIITEMHKEVFVYHSAKQLEEYSRSVSSLKKFYENEKRRLFIKNEFIDTLKMQKARKYFHKYMDSDGKNINALRNTLTLRILDYRRGKDTFVPIIHRKISGDSSWVYALLCGKIDPRNQYEARLNNKLIKNVKGMEFGGAFHLSNKELEGSNFKCEIKSVDYGYLQSYKCEKDFP